jgi:hypothetical protein
MTDNASTGASTSAAPPAPFRGSFGWARTMPGDLRFWLRVRRVNSGCWRWTGSLDSTGYGQVKRAGRRISAHRYAWEIARGPIAEGLAICHRCDDPRCVNPAHLFLGTQRDNIQDSVAKGRHGSLKQTGKKRGPYRPRAPR